jgi:hypothetical protein
MSNAKRRLARNQPAGKCRALSAVGIVVVRGPRPPADHRPGPVARRQVGLVEHCQEMTKAVPCNQIKNPAGASLAGFFALSAQRPEPSIFAGRRLRPCEPAQAPQRLAFTGSISKIIGKVDSNNH